MPNHPSTSTNETNEARATPHIGLFDSGVGGLSVLRAVRGAMPESRLTYFADSAHAPYGERDAAHVRDRSHRITQALVELGAQVLVVACNTATAIAIDSLRGQWPQLPIVGVEPGIKPALALTRNARIGVLATPATLASERFMGLLAMHAKGCDVICQPCPGLAARIEAGQLDAQDLIARIDALCEPLRAQAVDVVVLGCTHYPFVRRHIEASMGPGVVIVDTATAVARQVATRCAGLHGNQSTGAREVGLMTHADEALLRRLATEWLPFDVHIATAPPALA